ncbi:MAG: hypothetical protein NZ846_09770 [Thermus sp.]|nr:hypothetical protein [Thermus sp.]
MVWTPPWTLLEAAMQEGWLRRRGLPRARYPYGRVRAEARVLRRGSTG